MSPRLTRTAGKPAAGSTNTVMLLQRFEYNVARLLDSDAPVAICPAHGERLRSLVLLVQKAKHGVLVVHTADDDDYVFAIASRKQQGKLVSDTRTWKNLGYQFVLKRRDERFLMPQPNVFALPDGRKVRIIGIDTVASVFTQRVLLGRKPLPAGYKWV